MDDYTDDTYYSYYDDTCSVEDADGTVHYYEDGVEVETFYPDWG